MAPSPQGPNTDVLSADSIPSPAFNVRAIESTHDVVIVGAGSAGIAVAASLLARDSNLNVALIDPSAMHYYQPGWTMVGGGIFDSETTVRAMADCIPPKAKWIRAAVTAFDPDHNHVIVTGNRAVRYKRLVVCPGIKLNWAGVEGLQQTLGRNGVTSNYRFDLAPYTWQLVREFKGGKALFTQPPMPIKCAGAPQKAMYLACDTWRRKKTLKDTQVSFFNAGAALFGVPDYVPALMEYVRSYGIALNFQHTLISIDGQKQRATFARTSAEGAKDTVEEEFDMIHVVPPQVAPDFIKNSPLADAAGWIDVDPNTLQHKRISNIWGLGDAVNTTNAKTAAAARKQAPIVAHNVLASMGRTFGRAVYDGYGSCPLTVERGKIVLAEFCYGGKVTPTFPAWFIDGTRPSRAAWVLKAKVLPSLYWEAMLKGREWMVSPEVV